MPQRIGGWLPEKGSDNLVTYEALICMFTFGALIVSIIAVSKDKLK